MSRFMTPSIPEEIDNIFTPAGEFIEVQDFTSLDRKVSLLLIYVSVIDYVSHMPEKIYIFREKNCEGKISVIGNIISIRENVEKSLVYVLAFVAHQHSFYEKLTP